MSDIDPNTNTQQPDQQTAPVDDGTADRLRSLYEQSMASWNEHDPHSLVYKRPDLAEKYRAETRRRYEDTCARAGFLPAQAQETPIERADRSHRESYGSSITPLTDAQTAFYQGLVETFAGQHVDVQDREVADFIVELARDEHRKLALRSAFLGGERLQSFEQYLRENGQRLFDQVVADAKAAFPDDNKLPPAAWRAPRFLKLASIRGRAMRDYEATRPSRRAAP